MIKGVKLEKRLYTSLFTESSLINECNNNITNIIGNHRDADNKLAIAILEVEKNRMMRDALAKILQIKKDLYETTGILL